MTAAVLSVGRIRLMAALQAAIPTTLYGNLAERRMHANRSPTAILHRVAATARSVRLIGDLLQSGFQHYPPRALMQPPNVLLDCRCGARQFPLDNTHYLPVQFHGNLGQHGMPSLGLRSS